MGMKYYRFWLKGDREEIFDIIIKWAKAANVNYVRSGLDPRLTLITPRKSMYRRMVEFLFGGFSKDLEGQPFLDILLFDHGNDLIEVVFRIVEGSEERANIIKSMLEHLFPLDNKES